MTIQVLHISTYAKTGGACIAASRLHRALDDVEGVRSRHLVLSDEDGEGVIPVLDGPLSGVRRSLHRRVDRLPSRLLGQRDAPLVSMNWLRSGALQTIRDLSPDLVHVHWIGAGFLSVEEVGAIDAPVVWTLHDLFPLTGGCHYPIDGCERFEAKCGSCPGLRGDCDVDASRVNWERRRHAWSDRDFVWIAPSKWAKERVRSSSLFGESDVHVIPNAIETRLFEPNGRNHARRRLGLPLERPIVLAGAWSFEQNPRKGFDLLLEALQSMQAASDSFDLAIFGSPGANPEAPGSRRVWNLGHISEARQMADAYRAADVMVVPSRRETFGLTAAEALACGTPVVAFDTTGLRDIVDHRVTGYLARRFDTQDLARGLAWVLEEHSRPDTDIRTRCRDHAVERFDATHVARQHAALYTSVADHLPSA